MKVADVERRSVLLAPAVAVAGIVFGETAIGIARAAEAAATPAFVSVARLLTGKPQLSPELVQRAIAAIEANEPDFRARLTMLAGSIGTARLGDVEAFRASPLARDPTLMKTAVTMIRALYLGSVGKGWSGQPVSYEEALMFAPTRDVTVIPTYARGGPGNWTQPISGEKPA